MNSRKKARSKSLNNWSCETEARDTEAISLQRENRSAFAVWFIIPQAQTDRRYGNAVLSCRKPASPDGVDLPGDGDICDLLILRQQERFAQYQRQARVALEGKEGRIRRLISPARLYD